MRSWREKRIEGADGSVLGARGSRGQGVEGSNGGRWVIDVSQRVEVARVCLRADLAVAGEEGDALLMGTHAITCLPWRRTRLRLTFLPNRVLTVAAEGRDL